MGWLVEYVCRYAKYNGGIKSEQDLEFIWCELPMQEGYLYIAGAMSLDGWLQFSGVTIADGGFVKQETDKILKSESKSK